MTDLGALITVGLSDLHHLVGAWRLAWSLDLGYGPGAVSYETHRKAAGGTERPVPVPDDSRVGHVRSTPYSAAHVVSCRQLSHAVLASARLSWQPDGVADAARLEPRQSHVAHETGMRMAKEVNYALIGAQWRLAPTWDYYQSWDFIGPQRREVAPVGLSLADGVHVRLIAEQVRAALLCMPDELYRTASAKVQPTHRECPGYVFHSCGRTIAFSDKRCEECQTAADRIRDVSGGHDDTCRNPWDRKVCRGGVDVPSWGLCHSCDQYRRDGARKAS